MTRFPASVLSWDARLGFDTVAGDTSKVFKDFDQMALLLDESKERRSIRWSIEAPVFHETDIFKDSRWRYLFVRDMPRLLSMICFS